MRNCVSKRSEPNLDDFFFDGEVTTELIDRLAQEMIENFDECNTAYMSETLYNQWVKNHVSNYLARWPGMPVATAIDSVLTAAGMVKIKTVVIDNFLMLGKVGDYERCVRYKIDRDFEDVVLSS